MDAWWPKVIEAEFKPALGAKAYEALEGTLETGSYTGGSPQEPSFDDGWWGLRVEGPARHLRADPEGALEPRVLRRRLEDEVQAGAGKEPAGKR